MSVAVKQNVNEERHSAESFNEHIAHRINESDIKIAVDSHRFSVNNGVCYVLINVGKTVVAVDLRVDRIYDRIRLHIAMQEHVAGMLEELPHNGNATKGTVAKQ